MRVEVVFALPARSHSEFVELELGASVGQAIDRALDAGTFADVDESSFVAVSVFGEVVDRNRLLAEGDRVELLRALVRDPMQARRDRINRQRH